MRSEIRHIEPIRFANVVALVYAVISLVFVVLTIPFFLTAAFWTNMSDVFSLGFAALIVFMYPVAGLFFGWLAGLLSAAIYNLVAKWVGGVSIELATERSM